MALDKTAIINLAQKYQAKGQIDKAIQEWEKVLQFNPNDSNTHNTLGDLFLKKNEKQKAISAYFKAASLFKEHGFALKAMALYKKVLNLDPLSTDALLSLADLNSERGLIGSANEQYLSAAEILVKNNAIDRALNIYEKIMHLSPDSLPLHSKIAELYGTMGLASESAKVHQRCAALLLEKGDLDRAEASFRKAIALAPAEPSGYVGMSSFFCKQGRLEDASSFLEQAASRIPGDESILAAKASLMLDLGRAGEAIEAAESLLASKPDHPEFFRLLLDGLVREGRNDEAWDRITALAESIAENGKVDQALDILSMSEVIPGRETERLQLTAALFVKANKPNDAVEALKSLAAHYIDAGQRDAAVGALQEAQGLAPADMEISSRLGELTGPLGEPFEIEVPDMEPPPSEKLEAGPGEISAEDFVKSLEKDLSVGQSPDEYQNIELESGESEEEPAESGAYEIPDTELDLSLLKELEGVEAEEEPAGESIPEISIPSGGAIPELEIALESTRGISEELESMSPETEEHPDAKFAEDLAEGDFYLQQGLRDEAIEIFQNLNKLHPDRPEPVERLAKLLPPPPPPMEPPIELPVEPPKARKTDAKSFFDSIQGEPTESQKVTEKAREEMESIFEAFKQGVEHEVEEGDFDTHYNLGIAYKEMGLIDDALREFEVATRFQKDSIQGRSMMAMCYIENGQHDLAVIEYEKLLALLEEGDERVLGVKYDLAVAMESAGDRQRSLAILTEIHSIDPDYKDVQDRMAQLRG